MPSIWREPCEIVVPDSFRQSIGGNPITLQVLHHRGFTDPVSAKGFLHPDSYRPAPANEIPDLEELTTILINAIITHRKIGVWGDFDVDGQTATTILVSALRELGGDVSYHIPIRATESHGISVQGLQHFLQTGVELILTCDTGVTSHEAIEYANRCGTQVLISDHHDLPTLLPDTEIIVNPKRLSPNHPLSTLPGAGVAYKIVEHLFESLGIGEKATQYLDLVALGIVADLATLKNDTRYLLQLGLEALRSTKRLGLLSMMEFAELKQSHLTEEHISFILGPRLNAIGRFKDANPIVELLTTNDISRARILAIELEGLNAQRKLLTDQVYQAAKSQIDQQPKLLESPVLVLDHATWPAGIIGIVASHLVEQYLRPVILFSTKPGENARGSARSVEGVNITQAISINQHLLHSFGGHPMAAGLSIDPANISNFQKAINRSVQQMGFDLKKERELEIDAYVTLPELNISLAEDIERLAPFGHGNPPLILAARNLSLTGYSTIGKNDDHLQLTIEDELGHSHRSIWWQAAGYNLPRGVFDLAFSVRSSTYRGQRDIQIEWIDYRLPEKFGLTIQSKPDIEVFDYRHLPNPLDYLKRICELGSCIIWGEAEPNKEFNFLDRCKLCISEALVIWTIPPGSQELIAAIQNTKPSKVYLFAIDPRLDDPQTFLNRLLGLLKYCIKSSHPVAGLSSLAAATSQKISTIKLGLRWLESHGHLCVSHLNEDVVKIELGRPSVFEDPQTISTILNAALTETAAYRRYFLTADKEHLISIEAPSE